MKNNKVYIVLALSWLLTACSTPFNEYRYGSGYNTKVMLEDKPQSVLLSRENPVQKEEVITYPVELPEIK